MTHCEAPKFVTTSQFRYRNTEIGPPANVVAPRLPTDVERSEYASAGTVARMIQVTPQP